MNAANTNLDAAKQCLKESLLLIKQRKNEQAIRDSFTSHLRQIFTGPPGWVMRHIRGSESFIKINKGEKEHRGFVDNLLDLTAIEYESDLRNTTKFQQGFNQVKDYCSGLVNDGNNAELIIGVLSDTIRWYAYEIDIAQLPLGQCNRDNIILRQVKYIDCSKVSEVSATNLIEFLQKYLGRLGARSVTAKSIANDLGFDSPFCKNHVDSIFSLVESTFTANPKYSQLIEQLWSNFISYLREEGQSHHFDIKTYADEYYVLTLSKLICANYLEQKAIHSDEAELTSIIDGSFFENRGLINFVEYDYFGWLNNEPYIQSIIPIARYIQKDLMAYDFSSKSDQDLFGELMTQLAKRSQRLLLGQELTPGWLSKALVNHVVNSLPAGTDLQLLDMCCGSGSMIVETLKIARARIMRSTPQATNISKLHLLTQAITGFDIDPLAVMLSKINWVLTALDWLQPYGSSPIAIPIYHADSLFAITPVSNVLNDQEKNVYTLTIAEHTIELPGFLITPIYLAFFDELVNMGYKFIQDFTGGNSLQFSKNEATKFLEDIQTNVPVHFTEDQKKEVLLFFEAWVLSIDALNRDGRNGIWSYILRNSFRPGLVLGQFNGLVSNVPWLTLSKVADNPYQAILKKKAEEFDIKPPGSSHLHIELATIFLLHAIRKYLKDDAQIGCILPETILNGKHHNPFREFRFLTAAAPVPFDITEIWRVQEGVFKNNAVIVFGIKQMPADSLDPIPGQIVFEKKPLVPTQFYKKMRENRIAWSENVFAEKDIELYEPARFREGADIMPRNLFFYETSPAKQPGFLNVQSINPVNSSIAYIVKDAKKHQEFYLGQRVLPAVIFFDVVTSNLLTPFDVAGVQKALLPIKKNKMGRWEALSDAEIIGKGRTAKNTLDNICDVITSVNGTIESLFRKINFRNKLKQQIIAPSGYLVLTGAGGGKVCAAYIDLKQKDASRLIIDQTLYWAQVETEDEAIYLIGLMNSEAINLIIQDFQPRGIQGKRHVHKLPFGVTPRYNAMQATHQEVVVKTKALINAYYQLKASSPLVTDLLDPNSASLLNRRRKLLQHLKNLSAYVDYKEACMNLYGV